MSTSRLDRVINALLEDQVLVLYILEFPQKRCDVYEVFSSNQEYHTRKSKRHI